MAGAGKKTFTAGEILTASDTNTYLMEQSVMVFGGTAARSSAIPTPSEGMTTYRTDTQQIESYDGAAWRGMSGLQLVKKQTIGSGVSSVTVSDAFSATYENYLIQVSGGANSSSGASLSFKLGSLATGYYGAFPYSTYGNVLALTGTSNASSLPYFGIATTNGMTAHINVNNPFLTMRTMFMADFFDNSGGGRTTGFVDSATSQTAFTLTTSSGNMTGGTIYVYGYGT